MSPLRPDLLPMARDFRLKMREMKFSSKSFDLHFSKGTQLHIDKNEIFTI